MSLSPDVDALLEQSVARSGETRSSLVSAALTRESELLQWFRDEARDCLDLVRDVKSGDLNGYQLLDRIAVLRRGLERLDIESDIDDALQLVEDATRALVF